VREVIEVEVSSSDVAIEPGKTAQLDITITNRQDIEDNIAIEIEGIDVEWYALPVPSVTIQPGESRTARVLFRVGRSSDVAAGTYPFLVRARGMESGETGVQPATLTVRPFSALQLELEPKRATSTLFYRAPVFDVRITNLGNREETLDLFAGDDENYCAYEFERDRVTVRPGGSVTVQMVAEPRSRPIIGSSRLFQFSVTVRSPSDPYVTAAVTGQLERKAVFSAVFAAVVLVAVLAGVGFWMWRPKPVVVRSFTADPMQVQAGEPVTLAWDIENLGDGSYISPGNLPVKTSVGSVVVTPQEPTTYRLTARGGGRTVTQMVAVVVTPKPPPPRARILEFRADHTKIHQGDVVTLSWRVEGATKLVLNPIGELNALMDQSRQVAPDTTTTYVLTAQGADGDVVSKTLQVEVVPPTVSIADIKAFRADPPRITVGGSSVLKWSVTNAAAVEIDNGIGTQLPARGEFTVSPTTTTTYTLRAADNKGNVVSRQATVTVTEPPPVTQEEPTQPSGNVP